MRATEINLNEFSDNRIFLIKKELKEEIILKLEKLELDGKKPFLIFDTLVKGVSEIKGIPERKAVAEKKGQNYKVGEIENMILIECSKMKNEIYLLGYNEDEITKRVKIGVSARISEMDIAKIYKKKGMYNSCSWSAKIRYENGKKIIIVSPKVDLIDGQYVKVTVEPLELINEG